MFSQLGDAMRKQTIIRKLVVLGIMAIAGLLPVSGASSYDQYSQAGDYDYDAVSSGSSSEASSSGWSSMANQAAGYLKREALGTLESLKPYAEFTLRLPVNFVGALKTSPYNDRMFRIYRNDEISKAHTDFLKAQSEESAEEDPFAEEESGSRYVFDADDQFGRPHYFEYDLGFTGAGDDLQPIGFILHKGSYYYQPVQGRFVPSKVEIEGQEGVFNPMAINKDRVLQYFFLKALSFFIESTGNQAAQEKAKDFLKKLVKIATLTPQQAFMLRIATLIGSGASNSSDKEGYPRFGHIPLELFRLLNRLMITPDLEKTQNLEENKVIDPITGQMVSIKRSSEWKEIETVNLKEMIDDIFSEANELWELFPKIQMSVLSTDLQEVADKEGAQAPSKIQQLYGMVRSIPAYKSRTEFLEKFFLADDFTLDGLNQSDQFLACYALFQHVAERFRGIRPRLIQYIERDVLTTVSEGRVIVGDTVAADLAESSESNEDDESFDELFGVENFGQDTSAVATVHIPNFIGIKDQRIEILSDFVPKVIAKLNALGAVGQSWVPVFEDMGGSFVKQFDAIHTKASMVNQMHAHASISDESEEGDRYIEEGEQLAFELENFLYTLEEADMDKAPFEGSKTKIPLKEYLGLQVFKFDRIFNKKFAKDSDYVFSDRRLNRVDAIHHALSIFIRAARDLGNAENMFKADDREHIMFDSSNQKVKVNGVKLYGAEVAKPTLYQQQVQSQIVSARAVAVQTGNDASLLELYDQMEYIQYYMKLTKRRFIHFARQYPLSRMVSRFVPIADESAALDPDYEAGIDEMGERLYDQLSLVESMKGEPLMASVTSKEQALSNESFRWISEALLMLKRDTGSTMHLSTVMPLYNISEEIYGLGSSFFLWVNSIQEKDVEWQVKEAELMASGVSQNLIDEARSAAFTLSFQDSENFETIMSFEERFLDALKTAEDVVGVHDNFLEVLYGEVISKVEFLLGLVDGEEPDLLPGVATLDLAKRYNPLIWMAKALIEFDKDPDSTIHFDGIRLLDQQLENLDGLKVGESGLLDLVGAWVVERDALYQGGSSTEEVGKAELDFFTMFLDDVAVIDGLREFQTNFADALEIGVKQVGSSFTTGSDDVSTETVINEDEINDALNSGNFAIPGYKKIDVNITENVTEFLAREVGMLLKRSKDFETLCRLYFDEMLKDAIGMSAAEVIALALDNPGYADEEFNARFEVEAAVAAPELEIEMIDFESEFYVSGEGVEGTEALTEEDIQALNATAAAEYDSYQQELLEVGPDEEVIDESSLDEGSGEMDIIGSSGEFEDAIFDTSNDLMVEELPEDINDPDYVPEVVYGSLPTVEEVESAMADEPEPEPADVYVEPEPDYFAEPETFEPEDTYEEAYVAPEPAYEDTYVDTYVEPEPVYEDAYVDTGRTVNINPGGAAR